MLRGVERDAAKKGFDQRLAQATVGMWLLMLVGVTGTFLDHWLKWASVGSLACALVLIFAVHRAIRLPKSSG